MALSPKQIAIGVVVAVVVILIVIVAIQSQSKPVVSQPASTPTVTQPAPTVTQPAPTVTQPAPTVSQPNYVQGWQQASVADINMRLGGNSETAATCKQLARDGAYIAWGYRNNTHPDPSFRNTCFAYRKIVPFSGTPSNTVDITGCVADGKYPSTGCI